MYAQLSGLTGLTVLSLEALGTTATQLAQGVAGTGTQEQALINQVERVPLPEGTDVGSEGQSSRGFQIGPSPANAGVLGSSGTPALWRPGNVLGTGSVEQGATVSGGTSTRARVFSRPMGLYAAAGGTDDASVGATSTPATDSIPEGTQDLRFYSVHEILTHFGGVVAINRRSSTAPIGQDPFYGKKLTGKQVEELYSQGVRNFIGAILTWVSLTFARLKNADLRGADLREANLTGAILREADLTGANLTGANLINADLTGAKLREVKLTWARFTFVVLKNADLRGADFRKTNLTGADLRGAKIDKGTKFPPSFDLRSSGVVMVE